MTNITRVGAARRDAPDHPSLEILRTAALKLI
jgi:hypothetical protein